MSVCTVDTNVIVRLLIGDNKAQQAKALKWLAEGRSGIRSLSLQPVVIAEIVFVLESNYRKERVEIANSMKSLLSNSWIHVPDRLAFLEMWPAYVTGLHFVDSFLLAWSKINNTELLTFDKQLSAHWKRSLL